MDAGLTELCYTGNHFKGRFSFFSRLSFLSAARHHLACSVILLSLRRDKADEIEHNHDAGKQSNHIARRHNREEPRLIGQLNFKLLHLRKAVETERCGISAGAEVVADKRGAYHRAVNSCGIQSALVLGIVKLRLIFFFSRGND